MMKTKNITQDTTKTMKRRKQRNFDWNVEYREYDKPLSKLWKIFCYKCKRQYYTVKGYLRHQNEPIHRDSKDGKISFE